MEPFAGRPLVTLTPSDLEGLVTRAVSESLYLDYKQEVTLDEAGDKDREKKKDFLADLTAFANADGGLILIGIREARDADGKPTGVPSEVCGFTVPNKDELTKLI